MTPDPLTEKSRFTIPDAAPASQNDARAGNRVLSEKQLAELLRPGKEFESKLQGVIQSIPIGTNALILISIADYPSASRALLSYYSAKQLSGVYVAVNKPVADMVKAIGTVSPTIKFVDAITAITGKEANDTEQTTYLDSPMSLVEINVAITQTLEKISATSRFLVLDSVSTLLVYNTPQSVEKFCHTVIAKNRNENTTGIFLMIRSDDHAGIVNTLSQFVDDVLTIT